MLIKLDQLSTIGLLQTVCFFFLVQDVWHRCGPGRQWIRGGGERRGVLDWGGCEDAATSRGPQRGECVGQPPGQVWLSGLRCGSHLLEPVCCLSRCCSPGCGLLCGAAARCAAALRRLPLPFKGELSAEMVAPLTYSGCSLCSKDKLRGTI